MILGAQILTPLLVHKAGGEKAIVFADFSGSDLYDATGKLVKDSELNHEISDWMQKQFASSMSVLDDSPAMEFNKVMEVKEDSIRRANDVRSTKNFSEPCDVKEVSIEEGIGESDS